MFVLFSLSPLLVEEKNASDMDPVKEFLETALPVGFLANSRLILLLCFCMVRTRFNEGLAW